MTVVLDVSPSWGYTHAHPLQPDPMPESRDPAVAATLSKLREQNGLSDERRLYREADRSALQPTDRPGRFRLVANPGASESVVDIYGPGYVVQADSIGAGLAFVESTNPNWQETMELRAMQAPKGAPLERVEVEISVAELLKQGGLVYPVESVSVERAWYFTLPAGSVEVREVV